MDVERGLTLPTLEEDDAVGLERVGGERVLEASILASRPAHHLVALGEERVALCGIHFKPATDDDHVSLLVAGPRSCHSQFAAAARRVARRGECSPFAGQPPIRTLGSDLRGR